VCSQTRTTEAPISAKAEWYGSGYLANIVTYTVAKIASLVQDAGKGELDFDAIWQRQGISEATKDFALTIAHAVMLILTTDERPVMNVTEWAKRDACWTTVRALTVDLPADLVSELVSTTEAHSLKKDARLQQKVDDGIQAQSTVLAIEPRAWLDIEEFARSKRILTETDAGILALVTGAKPGIPSERQAARLIDLRKRAIENGYDYHN
jgi:hypothetical protein